jgi:hypothetical protein
MEEGRHSSGHFILHAGLYFRGNVPMSQSANDGAGWGVHACHRAWTEKEQA